MVPSLRSAPFFVCALIFACSGREPGDEASGSSTSSGAGESSTTTVPGATTAELPTTSGADATGEPATTTSASTTGVTGAMTGESGESGESGETGETTSGENTTGASDELVLDPATLVFFDLPINSLRYAVGGFDPDHGLCAAIIFFDPGAQQHCDDFVVGDMNGFPYVVITPSAAPCMDWDYAGNVQLDAASGCFQLLEPFPADIAIDMKLQVSGAPFTGTIVVASE